MKGRVRLRLRSGGIPKVSEISDQKDEVSNGTLAILAVAAGSMALLAAIIHNDGEWPIDDYARSVVGAVCQAVNCDA
jgi:hypothetical protein